MVKWPVFLIGLLLSLVTTGAFATTNLYQTRVSVASDSEPDRKVIVQQAYQQVLVKVAGNREILTNKSVKQRAKAASDMVTEFRFLDGSENGNSRTIAVQFDPAKIQDVLLAADQEIWAGKRPAMVLWLVEADPKSEQIYNDDNHPDVQQLVNQVDTERGIALTLPLLDLEDMAKINAANIRQLDLEAISTASNRYDAPLQLVGKIKRSMDPNETAVSIDWYLIQDFSRRHFSTSGATMAMALRTGLDEGIDTVARRYARRSASRDGEVAPVVLTVYDVKDINTYSSLLEYLRHVAIVQQVDIKHIGKEDVTLQMSVVGGRLGLVKSLADDEKLRPLREGGALDPQNLRYQLVAQSEQ